MKPESTIVPLVRPFRAQQEGSYVSEALASGIMAGAGPFTARAVELLAPLVGGGPCLLTTSCTHALEMAAMLLDLGPGDEVIVPSFTFPSTANAFVLRGATPVFVDIRNDTLNLDERMLEAAITARTRAVVVVHYGGVACDLTTIRAITVAHGLSLVEDNAHGLGGSYLGQPLGSFGDLATQSFHVTKNVSCGEGGALVVNRPDLVERSEILLEKGTDRKRFYRGEVDKYRWVDMGSSYLPSDLLAAVLVAQLESFTEIQAARHRIWASYDERLTGWAQSNGVRRQAVPDGCAHAAHVYPLLLPDAESRTVLVAELAEAGIAAPFHYQPLHSSPAGVRYGRVGPGGCPVTEEVAAGLVRLPLFPDLTEAQLDRVIRSISTLAVRSPAVR